MEKKIQQGAEATIYLDKDRVKKHRTKKSYRISELDDRIRRQRTKSESRLLSKAGQIINIPQVHSTNEKDKSIFLEYISGKKLSSFLDEFDLNKQNKILKAIGEDIAKLHSIDIVHGDLTTSNMILKEKDSKKINDKNDNNKNKSNYSIYLIDFGLGFHSKKIEDKAIDIHLLKQALEAKHFLNWQELFKSFLEGYSINKEAFKIIERLKAIEKRGRYKGKY